MSATSARRRPPHSRRLRKHDSPHAAALPPASPHGGVVSVTRMGTAGARCMVAKQVAAWGGLVTEDGETKLGLDPGPGAIVQYAQRGIDLTTVDAIGLSHRRRDHSGDVNVMLEAMTD